MRLIPTKLDGVVIIEPDVFVDHRGFFMESYSQKKFAELGLHFHFVQDNHSLSALPGVIRGLHYQNEPMAQTKVVRVLSGAIFDVAVDIRAGSSTFGQWVGVILSADNKRQLVVPKGFAHGICTLVPDTQIMYKVDQFYSAEHDRGILWNDPDIGIEWPVSNPILSDKDSNLPLLKHAYIHFCTGE